MKNLFNKVLFVLLVIMTASAFVTAAACNCAGTPDDPAKETISIELNHYSYSLEKYDDVELIVYVKGSSEKARWSSSDETVASVTESGAVTAVKEGKATITAAVGEVKAECIITVSDSGYVPTIDSGVVGGEITIVAGDIYQIKPKLSYNGKTYDDAVFSFSSDNEKVVVSKDGKITANGIAEGVTITVKASWRGYNVSTLETTVIVNAVTNAFIIVEQKNYSLYTTDSVAGCIKTVTLAGKVMENDEWKENAVIIWKITEDGDKEAISVEGNVVTAKKAGKAYVVGEYTTADGETIRSMKLEFTVEIPQIDAVNQKRIIVETGKLFDLTVSQFGLHDGKILSVEDNEEKLSRDGDRFRTETAGERKWHIAVENSYGETIIYNVKAIAATKIITTAMELGEIYGWDSDYIDPTGAYTYGKDCYYVLGNDIDGNGKTFDSRIGGNFRSASAANGTEGFQGTLNGMGYTVSNLTVNYNGTDANRLNGGLFGTVGKNGVVKNIAFTNVKSNNGTARYTTPIVGNVYGGTFENVFISVSSVYFSLFDTVFDGSTLKNIVVFAPSTETSQHSVRFTRSVADAAIQENIVFVTYDATETLEIASAYQFTESEEKHLYAWSAKSSASDYYVNEMAKCDLTNVFTDEVWSVTAGAIPVFKSAYKDLSAVVLLNITTDLKEIVDAVKYRVTAEGVTLDGSKLTVTDGFKDKQLRVEAVLSPYGNVVKIILTVFNDTLLGESDVFDLSKEEDYVFDASIFGITENLSGATVQLNGKNLSASEYTASDSSVIIKKSALTQTGEISVRIVTESSGYTLKLIVASKVIMNMSDFNSMFDYDDENTHSYGAGKYYVLGQSFDAQGVASTAKCSYFGWMGGFDASNPATGFQGVLDGRGYTISNIRVNYAAAAGAPNYDRQTGIFGAIGVNGIVKNIAFKNVLGDGNQRYTSMMGAYMAGTMENVYVSSECDFEELFFYINQSADLGNKVVMKNIVFNVTGTSDNNAEVDVSVQGSPDDVNKVVFENCIVITYNSGAISQPFDYRSCGMTIWSAKTDAADYFGNEVRNADLRNKFDCSEDGFWTIDESTGLPVFKTTI